MSAKAFLSRKDTTSTRRVSACGRVGVPDVILECGPGRKV